MSDRTTRTTLSDALGEVQREKLAARPMEVDFRAALALHTQKIMDIMDDKYLALHDALVEHERSHHGAFRRWWTSFWTRLRYPVYRIDRDED